MSNTINELINNMTDEQKRAVQELISVAIEGDEVDMTHADKSEEIIDNIFSDAKRVGSLKDSIIEHSATYGIEEIEKLFPEPSLVKNEPGFINNRVEWVNKVLAGVHKQPFSRIKTLFADITDESLRAKGYIKSNQKVDDVFDLLKRTTSPVTIYKKQKLDRDDMVDITDFAVLPWVKKEMRMKLDEELARAILIGDGRLAEDEHKIDEDCIRPIYNDDDLYTVKFKMGIEPNRYEAFANACVRSRKLYRGSGQPSLYTTETLLSELLLLKDANGRKIYNSVEDLAANLRVKDIVTINEMEGLTRPIADKTKECRVMGIIVNLVDYAVGTDKGGQVSMFDDFDIDYNQQKFLMETRCSGALLTPYSAINIEDVVTIKLPETPSKDAGK